MKRESWARTIPQNGLPTGCSQHARLHLISCLSSPWALTSAIPPMRMAARASAAAAAAIDVEPEISCQLPEDSADRHASYREDTGERVLPITANQAQLRKRACERSACADIPIRYARLRTLQIALSPLRLTFSRQCSFSMLRSPPLTSAVSPPSTPSMRLDPMPASETKIDPAPPSDRPRHACASIRALTSPAHRQPLLQSKENTTPAQQSPPPKRAFSASPTRAEQRRLRLQALCTRRSGICAHRMNSPSPGVRSFWSALLFTLVCQALFPQVHPEKAVNQVSQSA